MDEKDMVDELIRDQQTPNNNAPAGEQKPRAGITSTKETRSSTMAIQLTPTATERVRHYVDREGGVGLRLGVRKTGCSGWAYTVELAEQLEDADVVFEQDGVKVVVNPDALAFLDGSTIDFVSRTFSCS